MTAPRISVIVPVYRDWVHFADFMTAWERQDGRLQAELIVVDNDPSTPASPMPGARIVPCATPGSYAARNAGAALAQGTRLLFTDADCRPDPGWLVAHLEVGTAPVLAAGPVRMTTGPEPNRWEIFDLVRGIPQQAYVAHGYGATANLSVPADLFHRLGGFDAARLSGGDAEFCRRATRSGGYVALIPEAVTAHPARTGREALVRKARRVKGGQVGAGSLRRRLVWSLRTCSPPLREVFRYLSAPYPAQYRLTAISVRILLWRVEIAEMVRLWAGAPPER